MMKQSSVALDVIYFCSRIKIKSSILLKIFSSAGYGYIEKSVTDIGLQCPLRMTESTNADQMY
jgi:hypothetical protein